MNLRISFVSVETWVSRFFRTFLFLLAASLSPSQPANAQEPSAPAPKPCVAPTMARLLAREGNAVRVSAGAQLPADQPGVRENEKGIAVLQAQDSAPFLRQAHDLFEKGARNGYAPAQVNLALASLAGWGVAPNSGAALYWLHEAAKQGYALAYYDLGILYMNGCGVHQDYAEAFGFFELGANKGDAAAQMNLGYLYDQGLGVAQDRAAAVVWYRKAAEAGVAQAEYNLADLYVRGEGVPRDDAAAFEWFQKAAIQGHTVARIMMGLMYASGQGTKKDPEAAYMWLTAAAQQGDVRGQATLAGLERELTTAQIAEARERAQSLAQTTLSHDREFALLHTKR